MFPEVSAESVSEHKWTVSEHTNHKISQNKNTISRTLTKDSNRQAEALNIIPKTCLEKITSDFTFKCVRKCVKRLILSVSATNSISIKRL